ncbi:unnamed protein product [Rangifer tarandus platyrhynchus]|uniref:Uncharacterized protein n=2 Tax=Rangifer tarandus platyrhynchus TaxID=3082113 RepID=A0ABN8ZDE1_RANTA|nr:unnamed protein product [Rangifer tarandus platyrhynchus]CAI9706003.1 unnamed protein product [Rangifer tarandus platyrhynchus]
MAAINRVVIRSGSRHVAQRNPSSQPLRRPLRDPGQVQSPRPRGTQQLLGAARRPTQRRSPPTRVDADRASCALNLALEKNMKKLSDDLGETPRNAGCMGKFQGRRNESCEGKSRGSEPAYSAALDPELPAAPASLESRRAVCRHRLGISRSPEHAGGHVMTTAPGPFHPLASVRGVQSLTSSTCLPGAGSRLPGPRLPPGGSSWHVSDHGWPRVPPLQRSSAHGPAPCPEAAGDASVALMDPNGKRPSPQDGGSLITVFTGPEDQLHHRESTGVKWKHRLWSGLPPSVEVKEEPPSHPAESVLHLSVRQVSRGQGNSAPS